jgi:glycosyltransferase involved in cell wall biosynthesis
MAVLGKVRGWDRTVSTPAVDWRKVTVDVVVPAKNEENSIALVLSSLAQQDFPVREIAVFDDGSVDRTSAIACRYGELTGRPIKIVTRKQSVGKTPALREYARHTDASAIVVVDADTVLVSPNYISRLIEELFKNAGVAASSGEVMPLTNRRKLLCASADPNLQTIESEFRLPPVGRQSWWSRVMVGLTIMYRAPMYVLLQRTMYDGTLKLFGAQLNPVGCAVAYRTDRLRECFDYAQPRIGDNLTMSEDIYIGHFFNWKGWRNMQVIGVRCESTEPPVTRLARQMFLWSSGFLQSTYYFRDLPLSPFRHLKRLFFPKRGGPPEEQFERRIQEQYRAAWGEDVTRERGRPVGWLELTSLLEKVSYPLILAYLAVFHHEAFFLTIGAETLLCMGLVLTTADAGTGVKYALMLIPAIPIRLMSLCVDMFAVTRCLVDIAIGNRRWKK